MRLAAMDLLVGAAKRAEPLEGLYHPERKAGLCSPGALANDTVHAAVGQRARSLGEDRVAHKQSQIVPSEEVPSTEKLGPSVHAELHVD